LEHFKSSLIFGATFFQGKAQRSQIFGHFFHKNMTKNGLGYFLGDFFTNSSGHPGSQAG
jgi:hypothetical protein